MSKTPLEIIYFATPQFAVPILETLAKDPRFTIRLIVTQPDSPSGRGQKLTPPAVKIAADRLGLPTAQPESLKFLAQSLTSSDSDDALTVALKKPGLDFLVVVAYGKIIPASLLNLLPSGVINVHPSLLPRWRGAAPLQRALFAGDQETGTSIMSLDAGLDTGPVYFQEVLPIDPTDNFQTLHDKLAEQGSRLLPEGLVKIAAENLTATPQPELGVTYAEKWEKEDVVIRWEEPAEVTLNRIRASTPIPGARTFYQDSLVKIFDAEICNISTDEIPAGTIISIGDQLVVSCGSGNAIAITNVQLPGKKITPVKALANSAVFSTETKFSEAQ